MTDTSHHLSTVDLETEAFERRVEFQLTENKGKRLGAFFWVCAVIVGVTIFCALFCQWLPIQNPNTTTSAIEQLPSSAHWFGTDEIGRDIFSRVIWGSRVSVFVGFGAIALGLLIGGTLGMLAAYLGGKFDLATTSILTIPLAFPVIIAVLVILGLWQPVDITKLILVIGVFSVPLVYRLVRTATLTYSQREFVTAAKALGAKNGRVLTREVLPNVLPAALTLALIGVSTVVIIEGTLSFLGKSVAIPAPSWGNMIYEGSQQIQGYPGFQGYQIAFWPSLVMFLFLLSLTFIGDKLRALFDVADSRL